MEDEHSETKKRPMTVTFDVDYSRPRTTLAMGPPKTTTRKARAPTHLSEVKTADYSHLRDRPLATPLPPVIPDEFRQEVVTPIPLKPGKSTLDPEGKQWKTIVFPVEEPSSRADVEAVGEWLNEVLQKNQKETSDPLELATNARHWFTIAYEELCRQVAFECLERAQLLQSIWGRYQNLFARVIQLHQEEKSYLVTVHKERTANLKKELDDYQATLKAVSQHYRDDQERWSNSREREETKFANLRRKLDLQVKNRRNLMLQLKTLRQSIDGEKLHEQEEDKEEEQLQAEDEEVTQQALSDRINALVSKLQVDSPEMVDLSSCLDDIRRYVDNDKIPSRNTRDLYPSIYREASDEYIPKVRSIEWLMSALTYFYAQRLIKLCQNRYSLEYAENTQHFALSIFEQLVVFFGNPVDASQTFLDIVETARNLASSGNNRSKMFLHFVDVDEYFDSVILDFYCFCLGSFVVSNTSNNSIFPDDLESLKFFPLQKSFSIELARKVLFSISDDDVAEQYLADYAEFIQDSGEEVCGDELLEFLMDIYCKEEKSSSEKYREQFDMDAAQYGGIASLGQFTTLAQFSTRKVDNRVFTEMYRECLMKTVSPFVSFDGFVESMHRRAMLVTFNFDRIDYNIDGHLDDIFGFMKAEYQCHLEDLNSRLEKLIKVDEEQYKQLNAAKSKFEQVVETKRSGFFTEVTQRDLYERIRALST